MKSKIFHLFTILLGFLIPTLILTAQNGGPNQQDLERAYELEIISNLQKNHLDSLITWQERILVHVDKPIINEGSPLFFKAYTLTGPNRVRATLSKVLKVELVNRAKDVLATQYHKIEDGMAKGAFDVPKKLKEGTYTLRAYTRWMQNYGESSYYTKDLVLGANALQNSQKFNPQEIEVSFYPEGGNLISNFDNRMLIKATTKDGLPVNITGNIIDESGITIMPIVSFDNGITSAIFKPDSDTEYRLKTNGGKVLKLPAVLDDGYMLNVNNLDSETLSIRVLASPRIAAKPIWIKGDMNGVTYFSKKLDMKKSVVELEIPKKGIPFGAMSISLMDENDKLLSHRPVFIDANNSLNVSIKSISVNEQDNEVAFKVFVTNNSGEPIATEVTFSATNVNIEDEMGNADRSRGFTWEMNDLNNESKNPLRKERFIKDLELLTSNNDDEYTDQILPNSIKYPFQKGLDLFGYAYDLNNRLLKNTKVQMLSSSDANLVIKELETDNSGRIRIENLQLVGDNELVFRTSGDDTKSRLVKLVPVQESYDSEHNPKSVLDFKKVKNRERVQTSPWEPINRDDLINLEGVEVIGERFEEKKPVPSVYGIEPNRVTVQDIKRPKTIPQLFLGIPGVQVTGLGTLEPSVSLPRAAGVGAVLWVLDGMPLVQPTTLIEIMNSVSSVDVERIEILYGAQASIYGTRAAGGAIVIYTRSAAGLDYFNRKEGRLNFQGYYSSLSFDSYSEQLSKRPKKYEGKATTLFWNPSIKTDANGEAIIRFTPPIAYDNIEIKVSTVTENGEIASAKGVF